MDGSREAFRSGARTPPAHAGAAPVRDRASRGLLTDAVPPRRIPAGSRPVKPSQTPGIVPADHASSVFDAWCATTQNSRSCSGPRHRLGRRRDRRPVSRAPVVDAAHQIRLFGVMTAVYGGAPESRSAVGFAQAWPGVASVMYPILLYETALARLSFPFHAPLYLETDYRPSGRWLLQGTPDYRDS